MLQIRDGAPNSLKLFGLFSFLLLFSIESYAAAFSKFETTPVLISSNLHNDNDRSFLKILNSKWSNYAEKGNYKLVFNVKIGKTRHSTISSLGPRILLPVNPLHVRRILKSSNEYLGNVTVNFFGSIIAFNIPSKLQSNSLHVGNKKAIIKFFDLVASSKYKKIITRIVMLRRQMKLNDWGVFLLIRKLANKLFLTNAANVFTCFILNKLNFNVKVALQDGRVALLIYSRNRLYNRTFYDINHKRYYLFSQQPAKDAKLLTYAFDYPHANHPFNFTLKRLPVLPFKSVKQEMVFNYEGMKYNFLLTYNKNILDFLNTYPQVGLSVYLHAPMSKALYHQISTQLAQYIDGKSASHAMNFVLLFMQHSLTLHKKSVDTSRFMFSEQTLYYGSLNSFNRSVLYANIMHRLFDIAVRIAIYKHYAAVALDIPMKGYGFFIHGIHFVIADPSFLNGNLGQCRPLYQDVAPVKFMH